MKEQPRTDVSAGLPRCEELVSAGGENNLVGWLSWFPLFLRQQETEFEVEKHHSLQAGMELHFMTCVISPSLAHFVADSLQILQVILGLS